MTESSGTPLPQRAQGQPRSTMDLYTAYRKMFASLDDERVVWWYCGHVASLREGVGSVPHVQAETVMVYRTRDLGPDSFTIEWTEVGYFRDILTGEPLDGWFNPFTQGTDPYPKTLVDGPATFTVRRAPGGDGRSTGLAVTLVQSGARIDGVTVDASINQASLGLVQTEAKTRTFHNPDGSLPPLDSPEATHIETVLSIWSSLAALTDPTLRNVPSRGFYRSGGVAKPGAAAGGSWSTTRVTGVMCKARPDERVNPQAWARLQQRFPTFFRGDRVDPAFD